MFDVNPFAILGKLVALLLMLLGITACTGCQGAPTLQWSSQDSKPGNGMRMYRGIFGGGLEVYMRSDATLDAESLVYNKSTGQYELKGVHITNANASPYVKAMETQMLSYERQQQNFPGILDAYSRGAVNIIDAGGRIVTTLVPLLGQYLGGLNQVAALKAMKPGVVAQVAGAVASGAIGSDAIGKIGTIDPGLAADVLKRLTDLAAPTAPAPGS